MKLERRKLNHNDYIRKGAADSDCSLLIDYPCVIESDGKKIIYGHFSPGEVESLRASCQGLKYQKAERVSGLMSESRIFGYQPRSPFRSRYYCSLAVTAKQFPKAHHGLIDFGKKMMDLLKAHAPEYCEDYQKQTSEIRENWRIPGTYFTSGIVNKTTSLNYHLDVGNFKGVMSAMAVLKKDVAGGRLCIPELDVKLELRDGTYLLFDGQDWLHGVTPIIKQNEQSYRYSVVYYALEDMKKCGSPEDELALGRKWRMEQELKRAKLK